VILNDLEFIGVPEIELAASRSQTPVIVDLHEFFADTGEGFIWQLLHGRYYKFLLERLKTYNAYKFMTVSEDIAGLYSDEFGITLSEVMNIPELEPSEGRATKTSDDSTVKLIHHGIWKPRRGILRLIRSMALVDHDKTLTLMLVASPMVTRLLSICIRLLGLKNRVSLIEPSSFEEIVPALRNFDAEVIFFHPPHSKNEYYSLPNKFFEAIAAELALVVGRSPSMAKIVTEYDIGLVVDGWSHRDLAKEINSINRDNIGEFRENLKKARGILRSAEMKRRFLDVCHSAHQEAVKSRRIAE
jgi:glycosyltransferase involved in cell wall biosynthesis